jgi:ssDNA-binding Zn-finger/Zn-ribbon topoisomerase 1
MAGFITFICIVAGTTMLFRFLRKREMEAFREADMSAFEDLKLVREKKLIDRVALKGQAAIAANSNVVSLPASETSQPIQPVFTLKKALFDEVHRLFYECLEKVVGNKYRIFVDVPLEDFVRVRQEKTGERILRGRKLSFLVCNKKSMTLVCGIQLRGSGSDFDRQFHFVKELFSQIEKPLIDFPMINNISQEEIREKLHKVLEESPLSRSCPKCSREMMMRKAVKGKNAGKSFWVCTEFPSCNGISRIGRFS